MSAVKPPVVIFAYNRPYHLDKCLEALGSNLSISERQVFLFIDGPRNDFDRLAQVEIKKSIHKHSKLFKIKVIERLENIGLKNNIEQGVSVLLESNDSIIVLEDDLIVAPVFLDFMDIGLDKYSTDKSICQISGYDYLTKIGEEERRPFSAYKLLGGDCLAWATWRNRWTLYKEDSQEVYLDLKKSGKEKLVDRGGVYPYLKMLKNNIYTNKSWAINWYIINFVNKRYTVYPTRNLALHIGQDGTGSNYFAKNTDPLQIPLFNAPDLNGFVAPKRLDNKEDEYRLFLRKYNKSKSMSIRIGRKTFILLLRQLKLLKFFIHRWRGFSYNYEGLIFKSSVENESFEKIIRDANFYLEWGSGASTIYVSSLGITDGISIESDRAWKRMVESKLPNDNVLILDRNIGLTGPYSDPIISLFTPLSDERKRRFKLYSDPPTNFFPNVVLIDGKFRVACALKTLLTFKTHDHKDWIIIIDDYIERTQYHIVELFFANKILNGEQAYFSGFANFSTDFLRETIIKYELIID